MNTNRVNTAAGAIHASMQLGKSLPAALAYDLEAAGLLQSPETAGESARLRARIADLTTGHDRLTRGLERLTEAQGQWVARTEVAEAEAERLRARVAELETAQTSFLLPWAHELDAKSLDNFVGDLARAADAPLMFVVNEIYQTVARWRELVAQQPTEAAIRPCGCPARFDRHADGCPTTAAEDITPQVQRLRDLLAGQRAAVEDPHDSPLHHAYTKGRDLPEARRG